MIETNRPNVKLQVKSDAALQPATQEVRFKEAGLHVVEFRADSCLTDVKMEFSDGSRSESAAIEQIVERAPENIYISSGDEIYIDKQYTPYSYFFKWYISQRVGNWYQFRPSYQWSGCRITDPEIIGYYTHLLDGLKIPYAWQAEGRTLAGSRLNPSNEELASPCSVENKPMRMTVVTIIGNILNIRDCIRTWLPVIVPGEVSLQSIVLFIQTTAHLSIMIRRL